MSTDSGDLYRIVYISRSHHDWDDSALAEVLHNSRLRNIAAKVTGMLLVTPSGFVQVVEGPRRAVRDIFSSIQDDPRHFDVRVLGEGPVAGRKFSTWAMGFNRINDDLVLAGQIPLPPPAVIVDPTYLVDAGTAESLLLLYAANDYPPGPDRLAPDRQRAELSRDVIRMLADDYPYVTDLLADLYRKENWRSFLRRDDLDDEVLAVVGWMAARVWADRSFVKVETTSLGDHVREEIALAMDRSATAIILLHAAEVRDDVNR